MLVHITEPLSHGILLGLVQRISLWTEFLPDLGVKAESGVEPPLALTMIRPSVRFNELLESPQSALAFLRREVGYPE